MANEESAIMMEAQLSAEARPLTWPDIHERLKNIMKRAGAKERGAELEEFARELGCSTLAKYGATLVDTEPVLIDRILHVAHLYQGAEIAQSARVSTKAAWTSAKTGRLSAIAAMLSAAIALAAVVATLVLR